MDSQSRAKRTREKIIKNKCGWTSGFMKVSFSLIELSVKWLKRRRIHSKKWNSISAENCFIVRLSSWCLSDILLACYRVVRFLSQPLKSSNWVFSGETKRWCFCCNCYDVISWSKARVDFSMNHTSLNLIHVCCVALCPLKSSVFTWLWTFENFQEVKLSIQ